MKKIINQKTYNTETATKIAKISNGHEGDFGHYVEGLYLSPKGQYFIAGYGGPLTRYAEYIDNNTKSGGSDLWLVCREEALAWATSNLSSDEVLDHFGDMVEEG